MIFNFNVALFQYHLFRNIEEALKAESCYNFSALPSVVPNKDVFINAGMSAPEAVNYTKFISSVYRVSVFGEVFYFFFRNALNKSDNSYTAPSSLEIVRIVNSASQTVVKCHYFNAGKADYVCQNTYSFYSYANVDDMKNDLKEISDYFTIKFRDYLINNGII